MGLPTEIRDYAGFWDLAQKQAIAATQKIPITAGGDLDLSFLGGDTMRFS